MKAPEKIIEQRTCIYQADGDSFKIGDLSEIIKQYNCSYEDIEVKLEDNNYGDYILRCFINERVENKRYEEELRQYNEHIYVQRQIKLTMKEKAKSELLERVAKIEEEIREIREIETNEIPF